MAVNANELITGDQFMVSFDLCDFTQAKLRDKDWPEKLQHFFKQTIDTVAPLATSGFKFFKAIGDEVVFMYDPWSLENIEDGAKVATPAICIEFLDNIFRVFSVFSKKLPELVEEISYLEQPYPVKATAWVLISGSNDPRYINVSPFSIATASNSPLQLRVRRGIFDPYQKTGRSAALNSLLLSPIPVFNHELSGRQIDYGFRLARYSKEGKLVVSKVIAQILCGTARKVITTRNHRDLYRFYRKEKQFLTQQAAKDLFDIYTDIDNYRLTYVGTGDCKGFPRTQPIIFVEPRLSTAGGGMEKEVFASLIGRPKSVLASNSDKDRFSLLPSRESARFKKFP